MTEPDDPVTRAGQNGRSLEADPADARLPDAGAAEESGQSELDRRVDRLGDAMDAFLEFREDSGEASAAEFLDRNAGLRELLEPMVAEGLAAGELELSDTRPAQEVAPTPGQILGDYRIVRQLGRGGMGTVYEAEQVSLRRRVALKLLHEHLTWSVRAIARFRREAVAASRLQHPGIVPIYEVGEWRGRHYFTMEFLEGKPLQSLMQEPRFGLRADCSRMAEAAELAARVGDALQHAHEHGLVHRDVKPHNIMVGDDGSVKLLDFGLVKLEEPDVESVTAEFLGTPFYCSPEQVLGRDTGPASDVFSLGVVLYELLSGKRPFVGGSTREILNNVETGNFVPLSRAAVGVPRDLRTICEKAMELSPADRYPSAGEMAADLRRFLRIEPILATPPTTVVRCGKWLRRHRSTVALWATASLLVIGAPIGYAVHEQQTRIAVEAERDKLDDAAKVAFASLNGTVRMLAENLSRQLAPPIEKQSRVDGVVQLCEQCLEMQEDRPTRYLEVAEAYRALANINLSLDNTEGALGTNARALELLDRDQHEASAQRRELLRGHLLRQRLLFRVRSDPFGAGEEFRAAVEHWRKLMADPECATAASVEYASTLVTHARPLGRSPRHRLEAERLTREALSVLDEVGGPPTRSARLTRLRASCTLGYVLLWTGRVDEAAPYFDVVVAATENVTADAQFVMERTMSIAGQGEVLYRQGRRPDALIRLRRAIDTGAVLLASFPGAIHLHRAVTHSRLRLGTLLIGKRQLDEAEKLLRRAGNDMSTAGRDSWMDRMLRANIDTQLANCILVRTDGKDADDARELLHGACEALEQLIAEQPEKNDFRVDVGAAWNSLAALANEQRDHAAAEGFARRAIAMQTEALQHEPEHSRARKFLGTHQSQLAFALAHLGRGDDAVAATAEAVKNFSRHPGVIRLAAEAATVAAAHSGADEHARAAVAALEQMARVSTKEARRWLADERFQSLSNRADFRALRERVSQ